MNKNSGQPKSKKNSRNKAKQQDSSDLPGWPGYRTRKGRSGYDPIDTRTEAAHTAGTIMQWLFTAQTRNPVHLTALGILGLILTTPPILAILETLNGNPLPWSAWIYLLVTGIAGVAILVNLIRNLIKLIR